MRRVIKYIVLITVAGSFVLQSCKSGEQKVTQQVAKKTPVVKVMSVTKSKMVSFIDITGTIQANVFTEIKSPVDGIIESLFVRENQRTEKDKIIAVINPNDRLSLIANNKLQIVELEQKVNAVEKTSLEYNSLVKELEKAKSNFEYAKNMYKTVPVICPMNGIVTQRWLDQGSQISAKEKIITISDMNSLVIKAEANETYFEVIKQGKKLPVILNAYPNDTLVGIISLVYPQIDPVTRTVKFDIKIQNFRKSLLPGMMASIKIPLSVTENAIAVPDDAVITSPDNKNFLYIIDKDSIAFKIMVTTGISSGKKIEIVKGLKGDENVVVSGQEMLKDSIKVKVMSSPKIGK